MSTQDPFALLQELDQASRASAPGLPEKADVATIWSGLGFRVGDLQLVTRLDQVSEVVPYISGVAVPGTKRWLKGVANVRGELLTVVDLAEFLGKQPVQIDATCRLLRLNVPELNSAVLVSEVLGQRHFLEEEERSATSDIQGPVLDYLNGAFVRDGQTWGVFDMNSLATSEPFRRVAA